MRVDLELTIRLANKNDLTSVKLCAAAAYQPYVPRMGKKPAPMIADFGNLIDGHYLYVLEHAHEIVGYVVFFPKSGHIHLENIAVLPEYQGNGLGFKLIEFVETQAREAGKNVVELYTNEKMTENLSYYLQLGYVEIARRNEDGFNRVYFRKEL